MYWLSKKPINHAANAELRRKHFCVENIFKYLLHWELWATLPFQNTPLCALEASKSLWLNDALIIGHHLSDINTIAFCINTNSVFDLKALSIVLVLHWGFYHSWVSVHLVFSFMRKESFSPIFNLGIFTWTSLLIFLVFFQFCQSMLKDDSTWNAFPTVIPSNAPTSSSVSSLIWSGSPISTEIRARI